MAKRAFEIQAGSGDEVFLSCWPETTKTGDRCQFHVHTTHQSGTFGTDYLDIEAAGTTLWKCALVANDPDADDKYRQALLDNLPAVEAKVKVQTTEVIQ